jgi:hypothetical protein
VAVYQQRLFGGEDLVEPRKGPDEALARRLDRMALNREFHAVNQGNVARAGAVRKTPNDTGGPMTADVRDYGLPRAQHVDTNDFTPFSHGAWRRFGRDEEVLASTLHTAQAGVDVRRVNELIEDPSKGVNPRLPHEKPYVLRGRAKVTGHGGAKVVRDNVDTLINGNHRVASQLAAPQQTMFVPARVVDNTPENRFAAQALEEQRAMLMHTAEGARALREGTLTGLSARRTKEFIDANRAAYRGIGR